MSNIIEPQEASEWLLVMKENPDDKVLISEFTQWYEQKPEHAEAWKKAIKAYKLMGAITPRYEDQWAESQIVEKQVINNVVAFRRSKFKVMSFMAVAASILFALVLKFEPLSDYDYATTAGEIRQVTLEDGSQVYMGPESKLKLNYSEKSRDVQLLEGQAFFDVSHNPEKSFRVFSLGTEISVLGTAFDVNIVEDNVGVMVQEGTVAVKPDPKRPDTEILKIGDRIDVAISGDFVRGHISPKHISAWRDGRFIANDHSALDVVNALDRHYSGIVVIADEDLKNQPVTGMYLLSKPVTALKALAQSIGAESYQVTPWFIVISNS
ncbi:FecR family protein [Kiloniella majae]|uniref:FecR family protein n=1 Tax=Kiloniella majae TaxID=1938558 RepID=UPI001302994C|nr:FecR domain-containing protein [Kiloniella majae]